LHSGSERVTRVSLRPKSTDDTINPESVTLPLLKLGEEETTTGFSTPVMVDDPPESAAKETTSESHPPQDELSCLRARSLTLALDLANTLEAPQEQPWAEWAETSYRILSDSATTPSGKTPSCREAWQVSMARILLLTPQAQRESESVGGSASALLMRPLIPLLSIPPLFESKLPIQQLPPGDRELLGCSKNTD